MENPGSKNESLITLITQPTLFNVHPSRSAGACFAALEGSLLPPPLVEEGAVVVHDDLHGLSELQDVDVLLHDKPWEGQLGQEELSP